MNKSFLIVILLAFSLPTLSKTRRLVAEVSLLRGKVSQLAPGERLARTLKVGDKVREDTSILTGDKSFVQIKYDDGSRTSLGPNSKIVVVKMDKKGNGVLNLLKGRVRNNVKQDYEGKKKFYVRTRNAALGVRGTEFETIYNSDSNLTSLLTYKGEVAMVKTKDNIDKSKTNLKKAKRVVRNFDNKIILEEEPEL
ncbi:MAG: FecR domain-containing protein, partial [Halobacteriovoraceae bacterium]|nr:FecR domain-containing protein [Halobacteriovoraceae bacterium]